MIKKNDDQHQQTTEDSFSMTLTLQKTYELLMPQGGLFPIWILVENIPARTP